ncbi:unnamed protein product [Tilletia controversa]|nr:unnamed protein product [Tilletia controversa]CAD6954401.1 unnamed protein product [Tilletia controversa]CAD6985103.1 unnamed protein product [Tilletia controversa]
MPAHRVIPNAPNRRWGVNSIIGHRISPTTQEEEPICDWDNSYVSYGKFFDQDQACRDVAAMKRQRRRSLPHPYSDSLRPSLQRDTDLRRAARAQLATSSSTATERSAPPSILNQQIHSHGEGSGATSVGYVALHDEKAELEAQLRAKEVELEVLKANQKSLKGEVKASTTSSRTTEAKELNKLKEAKRALENDIDDIKRDNSAERMTWETEFQQLQADLNLFRSAFQGPTHPRRRAPSSIGTASTSRKFRIIRPNADDPWA